MLKERFLSEIFCISAILFLSNLLYAQAVGTTTGTLAGNATDDSNAPLPGVSISASGPDGIKITITDAAGKYIFPYLTPAHYNIRAELEGFTPVEQNDVQIGLGQRLEISFKMKASIRESVSVTSETPLIDLTSTSVGVNISNQLIDRIPIGRSLGDIIYLAPSVVKGGIGGANLLISGGSGLDNTYVVNGAVVTNPGFGGLGTTHPFFGFQGGNGLPLEAIKEVQVITAGFEPEYGEAQGGVINVITKSGSNNFHGQGYTYYSPPAAGNDLEKELLGVDAGVNMGGPIIKNKLFFFGAYNMTTFRKVYFAQPELPGYAVLKEVTNKEYTNAYSLKITSNLASNHTVEFSASGDPSYRPLSNQYGYGLDNSVNPLLFQSEWRFGSNSQVLRWNGIMGPNMFLEAQAARVYNHLHDFTNPVGIDLPRIIDTTKGFIDVGGFGGRTNEDSTNLQYSLKLTNLWKNHQFRYGLQFEDVSYDSTQSRTGGTFRLSNGEVSSNYRIDIEEGESTGSRVYVVDAWSDTLLGPASSKYLNWFAQDSWNLTSALNVTLGIRWERQQLHEDRNGYGLTFNNNWAPRIGATYDYLRNGNSKLFFHYGRFFEKLPNYLAAAFIDYHITREGYSDYPALTNLVQEPVISFFHGARVEGQGGFDSNYQTGAQYTNEWTAGVDQEVKPGFSLGAHFIARNLGRAVESILANPDNSYAVITAEDSVVTENRAGLVTNVDGHIPGVPALVRDYKAVEITAQKRFSDRWQLMASYRYAQLIGNYEGRNGSVLGPASIFALSPFTEFSWAKGPLPNDIRNMVKIFSSYQWRNLNTGLAFYFQTGRPITALKDGEFGLFPYSARGAYGRTNPYTSLDVNANYSINVLKEQKITFGLDLFNLFNSQRLTDVDEIQQFYDSDLQLTPLDNFLNPIDSQPSRSYRLLLRYSF